MNWNWNYARKSDILIPLILSLQSNVVDIKLWILLVKYSKFKISNVYTTRCKDLGIRIFEFVAKTQFQIQRKFWTWQISNWLSYLITNKIYLLWQKFYKIECEFRLYMLFRSIINSITSREKVTLSVLFQCRWLKLYFFYVFGCFFSEYINAYFL